MNFCFVTAWCLLFATLSTAHAGGGYRLASVDQVQVHGANVHVKFTLPCLDIDTETFVIGTDDSGSLRADVGVVYVCSEGPMKTFTSIVTPDWPEYASFEQVIRSGGSFAPMQVR